MVEVVRWVLSLILRIGLLLAGLVFFASLMVMAGVVLVLWMLRSGQY